MAWLPVRRGSVHRTHGQASPSLRRQGCTDQLRAILILGARQPQGRLLHEGRLLHDGRAVVPALHGPRRGAALVTDRVRLRRHREGWSCANSPPVSRRTRSGRRPNPTSPWTSPDGPREAGPHDAGSTEPRASPRRSGPSASVGDGRRRVSVANSRRSIAIAGIRAGQGRGCRGL